MENFYFIVFLWPKNDVKSIFHLYGSPFLGGRGARMGLNNLSWKGWAILCYKFRAKVFGKFRWKQPTLSFRTCPQKSPPFAVTNKICLQTSCNGNMPYYYKGNFNTCLGEQFTSFWRFHVKKVIFLNTPHDSLLYLHKKLIFFFEKNKISEKISAFL